MRNFHNVERLTRRAPAYSGYSHGRVYRILKTGTGRYAWKATRQNWFEGDDDHHTVYASTLEAMSEKLCALPSPYVRAVA